jgi:hypothetical protein
LRQAVFERGFACVAATRGRRIPDAQWLPFRHALTPSQSATGKAEAMQGDELVGLKLEVHVPRR